MANYRNLMVWQNSRKLVKQIYDLTGRFPLEEKFGLANQIQRAAVSIPSNIAEGYGRNSDKEMIRFLSIAKGSLYEVETQLYIAIDLKYLSEKETQPVMEQCNEIGKMITGLIKTLS